MQWYPTSREKRARCGAPGVREGTSLRFPFEHKERRCKDEYDSGTLGDCAASVPLCFGRLRLFDLQGKPPVAR